jgi:thymidylate synthase
MRGDVVTTALGSKEAYKPFNDYKALRQSLASILRDEGRHVYVSRLGVDTVEVEFVTFWVCSDIDRAFLFSDDRWFKKYSDTRIAFIEDTRMKDVDRLVQLLLEDPGSRRAYLLNFDFCWEGHDGCNLVYQFLIRDKHLDLVVFLRSSDVYNVLPLDLMAACYFFKTMYTRLESCIGFKLEAGYIGFMISSLHVYRLDLEKLNKEAKDEDQHSKS